MREGALQTKSFAFAVQVVNLCKSLRAEKREFILSKQLLRSGRPLAHWFERLSRRRATPTLSIRWPSL